MTLSRIRFVLPGAFLAVLTAAPAAFAQDIVPPNPGFYPTNGTSNSDFSILPQSAQTQGSQNVPATSLLPTVVGQIPNYAGETSVQSVEENGPAESPLHWGDLVLRPEFEYQYLYGNGIQSEPGKSNNTAIQNITPGLAVDLGSHWTADYTATWNEYSSSAFHDYIAQYFDLAGGTTIGDWNVGISGNYQTSSSPLIETAEQTTQRVYTAGATASYGLTGASLLELGVEQTIEYADGIVSREWSTTDWFHYTFASTLKVAVGPNLGYTIVHPGTDTLFFRPDVQLEWAASDRTTVLLEGGYERLQYLDGAGGGLNTEQYTATVSYGLFDQTKINVSAARDVEVGFTQDQLDQTTALSAGLDQRFLGHYYFDASYGYDTVDYIGIAGTAGAFTEAGRVDHLNTWQVSLHTAFLGGGNISISYNDNRNASNTFGFSFASQQYGFSIGYSY
jgi:hypothetical protein